MCKQGNPLVLLRSYFDDFTDKFVRTEIQIRYAELVRKNLFIMQSSTFIISFRFLASYMNECAYIEDEM